MSKQGLTRCSQNDHGDMVEAKPHWQAWYAEEVERLRADAERYRWLRSESARFPRERMVVTQNVGHDWIHVEDLDAAIDAARGGA